MNPLKSRVEAAAIIGIHPETLKKKVAARVVPFTRPAGTRLVKFSDEDIAAIIAAGHEEPERPAIAMAPRSKRRAA